MPASSDIYNRPEELLQQLIRFDTTNPPGNEVECVRYIDGLLRGAGIDTMMVGDMPERPNLIARLKGRGEAAPLLLQGHVDVVTAANQTWQHPPFEAEIADGYVWGRGALDMKGGVAMMLSAFLRLQAEGTVPPGDIVLAILSDEEAGGDHGAKYLAENHADLFEGIRYAIGEGGGFSFRFGPARFYAVNVAEKRMCWMKATLRGPRGHGSFPMRGGAMAKLGRLLTALDGHRLPVHVTPVVRQMIETMAAALPVTGSPSLLELLDPALTDATLDALGSPGERFEALLHNTVNATIVRGGDKINVIPGEITLEMDGRLLPGYTSEDMLSELRAVIGEEADIEIVRHDPGPSDPDMGLFDTLCGVLKEVGPEGIPVPYMVSGITDARFFSRLGIQTYGFLPMNLPDDQDLITTIHAADERAPVEGLRFGAEVIYRVLLDTKK